MSMKKVLFALLSISLSVGAIHAQAPSKPLTAEEKAAIKQQQEADLAAAYKEAGITDEQVAKIKELDASFLAKSKELYAERDSKFSAIIGKDTLKKFNEILKKKKESTPPVNPSVAQTPEEKAAFKKKQDDDRAAALKEAGFSDSQIEKYIAIDTELKDKIGALNKEKNAAIEAIAGKENYKKFKAVQKRQKDEAAAKALPK